MVDVRPMVSQTLWARGGKRAFEFLAAVVLAVLTSPIMLLAALLIRLSGKGPVFFVQMRGGRNGVTFRALKFRTMRAGRKPDPKELVPLDHPEITRVGRWLRRLKIDELPQIINVLKGDMALVGPRPTLPDQVAAYDDFRRQRLLVRPGITGLAQINGNVALSWDQRILYDIAYVRRCRLSMDLGILLKTLWVVGRGDARAARPFQDSPYAMFVEIPEGYLNATGNEDP
jgi:lipopolysaccharide/colanic/teichoic acid biosynthesis glycosyltransferase